MSLADRRLSYSSRRRKTPPRRFTTFNKVRIPPDFVLRIDTRETQPLFIKDMVQLGLTVEIEKLEFGDYSYKGGENIIAIERKKKSDFYHYIVDHKKTVGKLLAMDKLGFKALVVEESENDLYDTIHSYSQYMTREHVRGFIRSVNVKYNMHFYCNANRRMVEMWILDRLVLMYDLINGKKKYDMV